MLCQLHIDWYLSGRRLNDLVKCSIYRINAMPPTMQLNMSFLNQQHQHSSFKYAINRPAGPVLQPRQREVVSVVNFMRMNYGLCKLSMLDQAMYTWEQRD